MAFTNHKQVISVQSVPNGFTFAASGFTTAVNGASGPSVISKHSSTILTVTGAQTTMTFTPIYYTPSGVTIAGPVTKVAEANSPLHQNVRLHSFTGLTGGSITFLS